MILPYPLTSETLIWNEWNIEHIARHGVSIEEAGEVCNGRFVVLLGYAERFVIVGKTLAERMLSLAIAPRYDERYYAVTARPSSRKGRREYREVHSD